MVSAERRQMMVHARHGIGGMILALWVGAQAASAAVAVSYDNTSANSTRFYGSQAGAEAIDDVHAVTSGTLAGVTFEYRDPGTTGFPFQAVVTVYGNPGGLDQSLSPLHGPVTVTGLLEGQHRVRVPIVGGPAIGRDLWIGVRFSSPTAGLVINDAPAVGTSHDIYMENGQLYWFGGNPKANFSLKVEVGESVTAVGDPTVRSGLTVGPVFPNPVTSAGAASIAFELTEDGPLRVTVLDAAGRVVSRAADGPFAAGGHVVRLDLTGRPAGLYFVRVDAGGTVRTQKLILTR